MMRGTVLFIIAFLMSGAVYAGGGPGRQPDDGEDAYIRAQQLIAEAERTGITELSLENMGLSSLPPEIGNLTNLVKLDVSRNHLDSLPRRNCSTASPQTSRSLF